MMILEKVTEVNEVKRTLEARLREMEQFTYAVSHDLKTPVRSITSFAQLLKRRYQDKLDGEGQEFIDFIVGNGKRHEQSDQWIAAFLPRGDLKKAKQDRSN